MMKVVGCFVGEHNLWLVALAAAVCALAATTAVELLTHADRAGGRRRYAWLATAAIAGGSGIWATHFLAMLAYAPGVPTGYHLGLTILSFAEAVTITGTGFALATGRGGRAAIGGAVTGCGIAAMHYTGMAAYAVPGHLVWNPAVVAVSVMIGSALGAAALAVGSSAGTFRGRSVGAALLMLAICGHHFTGMDAVTVVPDPTVAIPARALQPEWLSTAVALASFAILLLAGAALVLDLRARSRSMLERERLRSLANAAVEGLVVCSDGTIVTANEAFARLVGAEAAALAGTSLSAHLPAFTPGIGAGDQPIETDLCRADGAAIPVEVIARAVAEYGRQQHHAVAVRDLRARRRAEREIHYLAHHDALTGLANRTSFHARLDRDMRAADAQGTRLAVLCLDLDRFKQVNDLFGHAAGDATLRDVAHRVGRLLDGTQLMARLGGDEFAILTPEEEGSAEQLAQRILASLREAVPAAPGPMIATSIGIAVYPDDARDQHTLLCHADIALYRAKNEAGGTCRRYDATVGAQLHDRRGLEHDLRHAVARGELELAYQPQARIDTGAVTGFEALLRWRHPERGHVSPTLFVPIAEESGAILDIGAWALREACRAAVGWPKPLAIAVNVSAVQIHNPHFAELVHAILSETGLKPERLEIEITETALIRDPGRALLTLRRLKAFGIGIAMDDFGTGYSSLSNLRTFPFDRIKIDRSFIRSVDGNAKAAAIVRSVLGLGRGLGLPVVAEGVETAAELSFLAHERCSFAQGYLLGRPGPIDHFAQHTHGVEPAAA